MPRAAIFEGTCAETVIEEIEWLFRERQAGVRDWSLPDERDPFFQPFFEVVSEDRFLASQTPPHPRS